RLALRPIPRASRAIRSDHLATVPRRVASLAEAAAGSASAAAARQLRATVRPLVAAVVVLALLVALLALLIVAALVVGLLASGLLVDLRGGLLDLGRGVRLFVALFVLALVVPTGAGGRRGRSSRLCVPRAAGECAGDTGAGQQRRRGQDHDQRSQAHGQCPLVSDLVLATGIGKRGPDCNPLHRPVRGALAPVIAS